MKQGEPIRPVEPVKLPEGLDKILRSNIGIFVSGGEDMLVGKQGRAWLIGPADQGTLVARYSARSDSEYRVGVIVLSSEGSLSVTTHKPSACRECGSGESIEYVLFRKNEMLPRDVEYEHVAGSQIGKREQQLGLL